MLAKLDAKCFHGLGAPATPPDVMISIPVPQGKAKPVEKQRECRVPGKPTTRKRFIWTREHRHDGGSSVHGVIGTEKRSLRKNENWELRRNGGSDDGIVNGSEVGVQGCPGSGSSMVRNVQTKCSTKWVGYGGCIPAILRALDAIENLDEAFRPWEERLGNKERSIILKEQTRWERAMEIFGWFKKKGCFELNVIHYNIMLRILGKAYQWRHLERLWDEMNDKGIIPINSTYGTLIDVYSKGGRREVALVWLGRMSKQGIEPDEVTMGIVIQMYKKGGEFHKAEDFFRRWSLGESLKLRVNRTRREGKVPLSSQENVCLSSHTYNTLIDNYGKAGKLQEASATFLQMLKEGITPTTVTFNTMIHINGKNGRLKEVNMLMQKMEELGCAPDTRTYNILISIYTKHDNVGVAGAYFRMMKDVCLKPDLVSYRTLLYAYSIRRMVHEAEELVCEMDERDLVIDEYTQSALLRMYIEAGMLEKSWLWFRRFHLEGNMSSECYSANIDAYGERGYISEAERVFLCCQEQRKQTVLEYNVIIKAYGIANNYDKACQIFDSMEGQGISPDKCSYSSIIQMLAGADFPYRALPYLRKMQEMGLVEDCIPYCALISSFVKIGQLQMAEGLYREMIQCNILPDVIVYGVLINACADAGSVQEAHGYVNAMKEAGLTGNNVIYNSLIKLYTKVGLLREAEETYRMLQLSEVGPDVFSSNCMIDLYSERSLVEQAEQIFDRMKHKGDANEFTYAMMLCMYKRIGSLDKALQIANQMRELGLLTDQLSYNNVLGLYVLDGRVKDMVGTFREMMEAAIQPDDSTFKSLGHVLMKYGVSKHAVGKLEVLAKKDAQRGVQAWMSAISTVVDSNYDG